MIAGEIVASCATGVATCEDVVDGTAGLLGAVGVVLVLVAAAVIGVWRVRRDR